MRLPDNNNNNLNAALGAAKPALRELTEAEVIRIRQGVRMGALRPWGDTLDFAAAVVREFCAVNNLSLNDSKGVQ